MLELLDRYGEEARTELAQCEAKRKKLKGELGVLGARFQSIATRLHLLKYLRADLIGTDETQLKEQTI